MTIKVIDQPLSQDRDTVAYVTLIVKVANPDGSPAVGAHIALSFSAAKTFKTDSRGQFRLTLPVDLLRTDATVTATPAFASVTQSAALYKVENVSICSFAGAPADTLDALGEYLDYAIPLGGSAKAFGKVAETIVKILDRSNQVAGLLLKIHDATSTLTTQVRGYELTAPSLTPLYVLTLEVSDANTGVLKQEYLTSYSRHDTLLSNVFNGGNAGGTPFAQIARKLSCGSGPA